MTPGEGRPPGLVAQRFPWAARVDEQPRAADDGERHGTGSEHRCPTAGDRRTFLQDTFDSHGAYATSTSETSRSWIRLRITWKNGGAR
jgi:hypothetical protein